MEVSGGSGGGVDTGVFIRKSKTLNEEVSFRIISKIF